MTNSDAPAPIVTCPGCSSPFTSVAQRDMHVRDNRVALTLELAERLAEVRELQAIIATLDPAQPRLDEAFAFTADAHLVALVVEYFRLHPHRVMDAAEVKQWLGDCGRDQVADATLYDVLATLTARGIISQQRGLFAWLAPVGSTTTEMAPVTAPRWLVSVTAQHRVDVQALDPRAAVDAACRHTRRSLDLPADVTVTGELVRALGDPTGCRA